MLIAVVLLFLLCRLPMLINQIYEVQYSRRNARVSIDNLYFQCRIQRTFSTLANFLQTINANGNLIMYLICCPNFRQLSNALVKRCLARIQTWPGEKVPARRDRPNNCGVPDAECRVFVE